MKTTTAQKFGSLGKSFKSPSAAAAVIGAALLASGTTDTAETVWSPAAACLLPDVLPVSGTLLSYGGSRQLAAGGTVTHGGALSIGANALTCGTITASGNIAIQSCSLNQIVDPANSGEQALQILPPANGTRIYFGTSGRGVYSLNFANVAQFEQTPNLTNTEGLSFGGVTTSFGIARSSENLFISASTANGSGGDIVLRASTTGYGSHQERLRVSGATGAITASGAIQETPTQSSLNPTTTDIPSGKRMGWYNSTLGEFRDWVNIGGTLLKSAAYT